MKLDKIQYLIINWLKKYAKKSDSKTLVIGISGGIDSALTSTLCAMTGIKTILLSMPIHQKKNQLDNANAHAKWLMEHHSNIKLLTIELTDLFENYKKSIPEKYHSGLNLANSRARLRMTTLYHIASKESGLVVGTGNKIEDFGIGFFTKYGDGGVDISPIADLTKSEVKELAIFCRIRQEIINAKPTDGLWDDNRNDETQIGATYSELEWAMTFKQNRKLTKREEKVFKIYQKLNKKNKHKMQPIPICRIPKTLRN